MSTPPLSDDTVPPSGADADSEPSHLYSRFVDSIRGPIRFLAFWTAIALPFVYVPLLVRGLENPTVTVAFLTLLVVNSLALYVGHDYNRP
ncbi:hypothetical protein [Natrialbaceae archaeon AArc-T1-2]|uniref:hypothetical protein n=1 Tax=Natrialbaceae archaeon AArc-T1-2 TaxID=3053904 RepID=UPI00255B3A34|nr:hypothetical protein [Natrialbaceae archaeon AArc-T1-2]WIV65746.1 hypothetical protein QQ977_08505 [Natrialbaceae archaeon AArc-T1-2]